MHVRLARDERGPTKEPPRSKPGKSANVRDLETRLSPGGSVPPSTVDSTRSGKEHGLVRMSYSSYDELDRILEKLT